MIQFCDKIGSGKLGQVTPQGSGITYSEVFRTCFDGTERTFASAIDKRNVSHNGPTLGCHMTGQRGPYVVAPVQPELTHMQKSKFLHKLIGCLLDRDSALFN